jgi:4-amino-4-deoxy-L-arabinose transferase-like glycosyltransferase
MIAFIKDKKYEIIFVISIIIFFIWSFQTLQTSPRYWFDEGINLQIARNFSEMGYLNLQVAPGEPYEKPFQFLTSGFPLTLPLGIWYQFTDFDFSDSRVYMLLWMSLLFLSTFLLSKEFYGSKLALFSVLLMMVFPPIVFHGRSLIGEIPGITLFFLALLTLSRHKFLLSGLLFGLVVATKPLFVLILPAVLLSLFKNKGSFKKELFLWIGISVPALIFLWHVLPSLNLIELVGTYSGRASQHSLFENVFSNAKRFFTDSSLIVTLILSIVVAISFKKEDFSRRAFSILIISAFLSLLFFLQSVGWNRYLVFYQAILVLLLPVALSRLSNRFLFTRKINETYFKGSLVIVGLSLLFLLQGYYFSCCATFTSGNLGRETQEFFENNLGEGNIYVVSSIKYVAMIPPSQLHQYFRFEDREFIKNRLDENFDYLLFDRKDADVIPFLDDIDKNYVYVDAIRNKELYERK